MKSKWSIIGKWLKKNLGGHLGGSVKYLTLDLSSGLDLRAMSSSPVFGKKKIFVDPYNVTLYGRQNTMFLRILNDVVLLGGKL